MTPEQQDKLFFSACGVASMVKILDSAIDDADTGRRYDVALNILIENCRALKRVVNEICPDEPREEAK